MHTVTRHQHRQPITYRNPVVTRLCTEDCCKFLAPSIWAFAEIVSFPKAPQEASISCSTITGTQSLNNKSAFLAEWNRIWSGYYTALTSMKMTNLNSRRSSPSLVNTKSTKFFFLHREHWIHILDRLKHVCKKHLWKCNWETFDHSN